VPAEARETQHTIQTSLGEKLLYGALEVTATKYLPFVTPIYEYIDTPNLGTDWDINYCAISCPTATVGFNNAKGTAASVAGFPIGFAIQVTLYLGNVPVYQELVPVNTITVPSKEPVLPIIKETAVAGNLQFPQTPRAFGGQPISIGLQGVITIKGEKATEKLNVALETLYGAFLYLGVIESIAAYPKLVELKGEPPTQITIGYTMKDYHRQPQ
jgi:hypothetical protein